jgi:hypothetical protein
MNKCRCYTLLAAGLVLLLTGLVLGCGKPEVEVSNLVVEPTEVLRGSSAHVSIDVENLGETKVTYELTIDINDVSKETKEVTLDARSSETITFVINEDDVGTHTVTVDGLMTTFEVTEEWRVSVTAVEKSPSMQQPIFRTLEANPGNVFLIVSVKCERMASEPSSISPDWFTVVDDTGRRYISLGLAVQHDLLGMVMTPEVKPGGEFNFEVAFVVPEDAIGLTLHFQQYPPIKLEL